MRSLTTLLLIVQILCLYGQGDQPMLTKLSSSVQSFSTRDVFYSGILKEERVLDIYLPETFHESSKDHVYPVIVITESNFFHVITGIVRHLSAMERMPECIVVSLNGAVDVPKVYTNGSDFWPPHWKQLPFGRETTAFLLHLEKELFPYLERNFRAAPFRMAIGFSGSSVFVFDAFFKKKELFQAHVALAAGDVLGMGYEEGVSFLDMLERKRSAGAIRKAKLYVASALSDVEVAPMIGENLQRLQDQMSPYVSDDVKVVSKVYPDEGHYDMVLPAMYDAMKMIFPIEQWSHEYQETINQPGNALENIDDFYRKLSSVYGFPILPKTERWNSGNSLARVGSSLMIQKRYSEAVEVFKRRARYRPLSVRAQIDLARSFTKAGQMSNARKAANEAIRLAEHEQHDVRQKENYIKELNDLNISIEK